MHKVPLLSALLISLHNVVILTAVISYTDLIDENAPEEDTFLTPDDFERSKTLKEVGLRELLTSAGISHVDFSKDPLLRAGRFEGDIAGINSSYIKKYISDSNKLARNAVTGQWRLWRDGEIPYALSSKYGVQSRSIIAKAMDAYHQHTCIRFKPKEDERDYIYIYPDDGCYSMVGRHGGKQPLSLDVGCLQVGTVIHELMHTVGFFHEQSRADRDEHIEIHFQNVERGALDQFEKYNLRTIQHLGVDYDYNSIMHYGPYAFTKNGKRTITPKKPGGYRMGQREGFTSLDILKINRLYQCEVDDPNSSSEKITVTIELPTKQASPKPVTKPVCEDQSWRCKFWRLFGYCDDPAYKIQCPKTCNNCPKPTEEKINPTTSGTTPTTLLRTTRSIRTGVGSGRPEKPNQTRGTIAHCPDLSEHCPRWAQNGYCKKPGFVEYMKKTCALSCGRCSTDEQLPYTRSTTAGPVASSGTDEDPAVCIDKLAKCPLFAAKGYCRGNDRSSDLTIRYCRKSCGKC